jgi:hypothetical protein
LLAAVLEREDVKRDCVATEVGIAAQGMAKATHLLAGKYHLVTTNVPYLARGRQGDKLREFCARHYPEAKNDIATVFLDRCLEFCVRGGTCSIVLPQNWLFLTTYKQFREKTLRQDTWHMITRLGAQAFQTPMWDFNVQLLIISWVRPRGTQLISGLDVSTPRTASEKAELLSTAKIKRIDQATQLKNPDARVTLEIEEDLPLLSQYADALVGLQTSDDPMFIIAFWEIEKVNKLIWEFLQGTPEVFKEVAGASWLVRWEQGNGLLLSLPTAYPTKGLKAIGKHGVSIHRMQVLFAYRYQKERFHQNVAVMIPHNLAHLSAIWCFCSSPKFNESVRRIDQTLKVTNATLGKVPFDLAYWQKIAAEKYPHGLLLPYSDDPTQWLFHGYPAKSEEPMQVAIARLLRYRWPAELDPEMELSDEARAWVQKSAELLPLADEDGIVCIPAVRGESPAAERLQALLAQAYGEEWSPAKLAELLNQVGYGGKNLETWLRDGFFEQHCKLFHQRPFIWHIWDGRKDGFHALVNYHKMDRRNLETLTYAYLGDWLKRQQDGVQRGGAGTEGRLAAAQILQDKLKLILEGEKPYDIFVRWKSLEQQPSGWDPDLNDGVRLNIRPFMVADILRKRPNIKWNKDRGKDPEGAPWYHKFKGERLNDHHLSLAEKRQAREQAEKG